MGGRRSDLIGANEPVGAGSSSPPEGGQGLPDSTREEVDRVRFARSGDALLAAEAEADAQSAEGSALDGAEPLGVRPGAGRSMHTPPVRRFLVRAALETLPERQRVVLRATVLEPDLTLSVRVLDQQAGRALGCSWSTVRRKRERGLESLREWLDDPRVLAALFPRRRDAQAEAEVPWHAWETEKAEAAARRRAVVLRAWGLPDVDLVA